MKLKALILNCTLKKSPEESNTRSLIDKVVAELATLDVESEVIRIVDHDVKFGVKNDMGDGDAWPEIYEKVKACNILIIGSPIWMGVRGSVTQLVMERLDGSYADADEETGQFPLYNKVAGIIITGNEDGAHDVAANTLFNLTHLGCTVPPNADTYWVGPAGPGKSYNAAGGEKHQYTNKTLRHMAHNLAWMAGQLQKNPIPTNLKKLTEEAEKVSDNKGQTFF